MADHRQTSIPAILQLMHYINYLLIYTMLNSAQCSMPFKEFSQIDFHVSIKHQL